ncbi:MAG: cation transporter, partial [Actinobacteria bacterium]|nr:cation transporter [Actinomycetota bacterium]
MHAHGHGHAHGHARDRRALATALGLILALMAGEVVAGIAGGSLALLADAGHMLTDAAALGAALVAARLATRPAGGAWTFGLGRAEILAAQANGVSLLVVGLLIVYSAVRRLISPPHVHAWLVVAVACAGIAVNALATWVLSRADRESLNIRGAFLHVATDLAAFAGTALAGGLILLTGWTRFDAVAGLVVAMLMLRSAWSLLRDSGRIFLEGAPAEIDPHEV